MFRYPKQLLHDIECCRNVAGVKARASWAASLAEWFDTHLTSEGLVRDMMVMAEYAGDVARAVARNASGDVSVPAFESGRAPVPPKRVLWLGSWAAKYTDYQETAVYSGLVQAWGSNVVVESPHHMMYMYDDWETNYWVTRNMYGGGYSYVHAIKASLRGPSISNETALMRLRTGAYDLIVYSTHASARCCARAVQVLSYLVASHRWSV